MTRLIANRFITLNRVFEAPGAGDVTLPNKRRWSMPYTDKEVGVFIMSGMASSGEAVDGTPIIDIKPVLSDIHER